MAPELLQALPVGTIVLLDNELGEVIQSGSTVHIIWPESGVTSLIDTKSKAWKEFIGYLETE